MTTRIFLNSKFLLVRRLITINVEKEIISELKSFYQKETIDKSSQTLYISWVKFIRKLAMDCYLCALFFQLLLQLPTNQQSLYCCFQHLEQLMNTLLLIHFTLQKRFVNRTPTYTQLVQILFTNLQISLFTNIPLDEIINICIDNLYNGNYIPPNCRKHDFRNSLNIATKELVFTFSSEYQTQVDGVAVGSPLGPALADVFMCSFKRRWLRDCPNDFKPIGATLMTYLHCFILLIMQINLTSIHHLKIST